MRIADIVINRPSKKLDRTFSYLVPAELSFLDIGWRVIVSFSGKWEEGIILQIREEKEKPNFKLKKIHEAIGTDAWFTKGMLAMADYIAEYYLCTKVDALRLFMIDKQGLVTKKMLMLTERGRLEVGETVPKWGTDKFWQGYFQSISSAVQQGFLLPVIVPMAKRTEKTEWWLKANPGLEEQSFGRKQRQKDLYLYLLKYGASKATELKRQGFSYDVQCSAAENGFVTRWKQIQETESYIHKTKPSVFELTNAQKNAIETIVTDMQENKNHVYLLHGVTSSGKTEVYIRTAEMALQANKSVLILVPEIALTEQMVHRMAAHFGDQVVYIHSQLNASERLNNWKRVYEGSSKVVVGARSAIFMPFHDLGLVVVDEEYDSSYKQEETPRYHACHLAEWLGQYFSCPVVRGAATPSIATYYRVERGEIRYLRLPKRIGEIPLPKISIVDMRSEMEIGNRSILSREMRSLIERTLADKKQVILLLNRRGYATHVFCRSCGHVMMCDACERPLTYHMDTGQLLCHYCEKRTPVPQRCPACGSRYIKYFGIGTQKAVELVRQAFPKAKVGRLDRDTMMRKEGLSKALKLFRDAETNILVGTQIVAKGHDIPNVRAVGILSVDGALNFPEYSAAERVFNLITQASGRAGRRNEQGEVVLQTYHPSHYAIKAAANYDYSAYYKQEIALRRAFQYPPLVKMLRVTVFGENRREVEVQITELHACTERLINELDDEYMSISQPYDDYIHKIRDRYYMSFEVRGERLSKLKEKMRNEPKYQRNGIIIDVDAI